MNSHQAKKIPIENLLSQAGVSPSKKTGEELWYHSPLTKRDKTPSFKVNRLLNTWYDFSIGKGGTIIDLVCTMYNESVKDALQRLSKENHSQLSMPLPSLKKNQISQPKNTLLLVTDIHSTSLISYLEKRAINLSIACQYLKEVHFQSQNKNSYYAVAINNMNGGYEYRNEFMQGSVGSEKSITYIQGKNSENIVIFEGFFDFLSFLTHHDYKSFQSSIVILNSVSLKQSALKLLKSKNYKKAYFFLDNDNSGKDCLSFFQEKYDKPCLDKSYLYKGYKDYNEYYIDLLKK